MKHYANQAEFGQKRMSDWIVRMGFATVFANCLSGPLWSRAYTFELPYWLIQTYNFVILLTFYCVNKFGEGDRFKKFCFYNYELIRNISIVIDIITILVFTITENYFILMIGDMATIMACGPSKLVMTELGSARFRGNARAKQTKRNEKYQLGAEVIAMLLGIVIGSVFVTGTGVPHDLLLTMQWLNVMVVICVAIPNTILYRISKSDVEQMWLED